MNVRHFTRASADWIDTSLGNAPVFGPATVLALVKKSSDTTDFEYITQVSQAGDPNNWQFYVGLSGDNKPALWNGAADLASPFTVTAAEGWVLLGCSKATGTVAPRFHKYVLSTGVWTHQDCASSGANSGASLSTRNIIGSGSGHTVAGAWDGHILAVGMWNVVLNDAALEAIDTTHYADFSALITGWLATATAPRLLWRLDQATAGSTVTDETGGGANSINRSGTSVVTNDDPTFGPLAAPGVAPYYFKSLGMQKPVVYT